MSPWPVISVTSSCLPDVLCKSHSANSFGATSLQGTCIEHTAAYIQILHLLSTSPSPVGVDPLALFQNNFMKSPLAWRRYGSQTALDLLAAAYKNSFELMDEYCQHFYLLNRSEAGLEPDKEVAPFPTTALQQRIALPLSALLLLTCWPQQVV